MLHDESDVIFYPRNMEETLFKHSLNDRFTGLNIEQNILG